MARGTSVRGHRGTLAEWQEEWEAELARRRLRLRAALGEATERPSPKRLHEVRRQLRALRVYTEGTPAGKAYPFSSRLRALQGELGGLHDLAVLMGLVPSRRAEGELRRWSASLRAESLRAQRRVLRRLASVSLRVDLARLLGGP